MGRAVRAGRASTHRAIAAVFGAAFATAAAPALAKTDVQSALIALHVDAPRLTDEASRTDAREQRLTFNRFDPSRGRLTAARYILTLRWSGTAALTAAGGTAEQPIAVAITTAYEVETDPLPGTGRQSLRDAVGSNETCMDSGQGCTIAQPIATRSFSQSTRIGSLAAVTGGGTIEVRVVASIVRIIQIDAGDPAQVRLSSTAELDVASVGELGLVVEYEYQ